MSSTLQIFIYPIVVVLAYLIGSLSAAIITCKIMGLPDPRTTGSNNPGATNVLRIGGKKAAIFTLIGDLLKGLIPVMIVKFVFPTEPLLIALTALAAFLGHLFPVFFQFKGGKGVATALGCIIGLNLWVALCAFGVWLAIFLPTRISSLSALTAAVVAPIFLWLFDASISVVIAIVIMDILLIIRHKENIQRILKGEEKKMTFKK
ncbi:glycerol-3-phosphate 1-O-acyltransferase PlsY [Wohlfahrtiimonas populi]|uniref:glycerol-3-phosphate 1-O-acyltransferase PlsY n=1 Tax=Wohlfahrtiimonas populi TaxID=1940240 RepID=UPI00098D49F4